MYGNPPLQRNLSVKNICYGAILNALKAKVKLPIIKQILVDFENDFPNWSKNKYIYCMSRRKRIFLKMLKLRLFWGLKVYTKIHSFLLKRRSQ